MTVAKLIEALDLTVLSDNGRLEEEVAGCYIGDLLSWVMSHADGGDVWITVMGNINAVAVASLTDCACILLCEGSTLSDEAKTQAGANDVLVLGSDEAAFSLARRIGVLLEKSEV